MKVEFFDYFDMGALYKSCVAHTGDKEYCGRVVDLLAESAVRREFVYGHKVQLRAVLPSYGYRQFAVVTDKERRAAVIFMRSETHVVVLFYEKSDGEFRLKFVDWITTELKSLKNPHPTAFTQHL